jgi:hypothetical protein
MAKKRLRFKASTLAASKSGSPRRLSKATQAQTVRLPSRKAAATQAQAKLDKQAKEAFAAAQEESKRAR